MGLILNTRPTHHQSIGAIKKIRSPYLKLMNVHFTGIWIYILPMNLNIYFAITGKISLIKSEELFYYHMRYFGRIEQERYRLIRRKWVSPWRTMLRNATRGSSWMQRRKDPRKSSINVSWIWYYDIIASNLYFILWYRFF